MSEKKGTVAQRHADLPATIAELRKYVAIGRRKYQAHKEAIKALDDIGEAKETRDGFLERAKEELAKVWLAYARLGQLLPREEGGPGRGIKTSNVILDFNVNDRKHAYGFADSLEYPNKDGSPIFESCLDKIETADKLPAFFEPYNLLLKEKRRALIEQIRAGEIISPDGIYDVIVYDPPWPYGTEYSSTGRRAANPYPEQSLEAISDTIPNTIHPAENCVLWLWTTHKFMRHSFGLLDSWSFDDVAILTWVKDKMGLGSWLRSQSEFCIMAKRGKPVIDLTNQTTVIHGKMREHSRKPDEFYEMVAQLCPGRRLDYPAREGHPGFEVGGLEPEKFNV